MSSANDIETVTPIEASPTWSVLGIVGVAQLMVMLDSTVVNVAIPSIASKLNADPKALQWTVSAYIITYGSLLLFGGRVADILGRRRTFLSGLTLFALGSLLCGVAPNDGLLIAGRALQGVGAALLSAAALSIVVSTYQTPQLRKVALTTWSGLGVVGASIGVVLGGFLVTTLSWRWAFFINLPISIVTGVLALRAVPTLRAGSQHPVRLPTAIVVTAGLACLSYGLITLQGGWASYRAWASIVISVVLLAGLTVSELKQRDPLLPLHLLAIRTYALSSVGLLLAAAVMISSSYLASIYFQRVHGLSAIAAGFSLLPMGLTALVIAFRIPALATRFGVARVYTFGACMQLIGTVAIIFVDEHTSMVLVIVALAVIGFGLPTCFAPLYTIGTSHIRPEQSGVGSGLLNTFNQTGAAIGIAISGSVAAAVTRHETAAHSVPHGVAQGTEAGFVVLAIAACLSVLISLVMSVLVRQQERASA